MDQLITTRKFIKSGVSISANGFARIDIDVSLSGYTPIGVLGWSGSASQGDEYAGRFNVEGNTLTFIVFNKATSSKTDSFSFNVLYKKA